MLLALSRREWTGRWSPVLDTNVMSESSSSMRREAKSLDSLFKQESVIFSGSGDTDLKPEAFVIK